MFREVPWYGLERTYVEVVLFEERAAVQPQQPRAVDDDGARPRARLPQLLQRVSRHPDTCHTCVSVTGHVSRVCHASPAGRHHGGQGAVDGRGEHGVQLGRELRSRCVDILDMCRYIYLYLHQLRAPAQQNVGGVAAASHAPLLVPGVAVLRGIQFIMFIGCESSPISRNVR